MEGFDQSHRTRGHRLDQESRAPATLGLGLKQGGGLSGENGPVGAVHRVESWVQELLLPPELSFPYPYMAVLAPTSDACGTGVGVEREGRGRVGRGCP